GDRSKLYAINGRTTADMLWLAGKLKGAEARGEMSEFALDPNVERIRQQLLANQRDIPEQVEGLFGRIVDELAGKSALMFMPWHRYYEFAIWLRDNQKTLRLNPDSFLFSGGGSKWTKDLPEGWRETVREHIPFELGEGYGMSELPGSSSRKCRQNN